MCIRAVVPSRSVGIIACLLPNIIYNLQYNLSVSLFYIRYKITTTCTLFRKVLHVLDNHKTNCASLMNKKLYKAIKASQGLNPDYRVKIPARYPRGILNLNKSRM